MSGVFESCLRGLLRPTVINAATMMLREAAPGVVKSYDAAVSVVLDGLAAGLANPAKRGSITVFVAKSGVACSLADIGSLLNPGVTPPAVAAGNHLLDLLFGDRVGAIANQIGRSSGVKSSSAYILLSLTASAATGELSRRLNHERISAARMVRLLDDQQPATLSLARLRRPSAAPVDGSSGTGRTGRPAAATRSAAGVTRAMALWTIMLSLASVLGFVLLNAIVAGPAVVAGVPGPVARVETASVQTGPVPSGATPAEMDARRWPMPAPSSSALASTLPVKLEGPQHAGDEITAPEPRPSPAAPSVRTTATASADQARSMIRPVDAEPVAEGRIALNSLAVTSLTVRAAEAAGGVEASVEDRLIAYIEEAAAADATRWFDFDGIKFKAGSAALTEGSSGQIELLVEILAAFPQVGLVIGGHTDDQGNPGHNKTLSEGRARAVVAALVKRGVPPPRLKASGFGAERPIADNATAVGRARNRRIAVAVSSK